MGGGVLGQGRTHVRNWGKKGRGGEPDQQSRSVREGGFSRATSSRPETGKGGAVKEYHGEVTSHKV